MSLKILLYILKRLAFVVPTLLGLVVLVFLISHIIPADPVGLLAGEFADEVDIQRIKQNYGLDKPLFAQLLIYLQNLAQGDFGESLFTRRPILQDIILYLPPTIELALFTLVWSMAVGIYFGILSATKRGSVFDHTLRTVNMAGIAMASFWLGIMLQILFSTRVITLPIAGRLDVQLTKITGFVFLDSILTLNWEAFLDGLKHIILPSLTIGAPAAASITRFTRAGVLDVLASDYTSYEKAMGLPHSLIVFKYVLRNAIISSLTQFGLVAGRLLAGVFVVEIVFSWPGIGRYAVNAIFQSDYQAVLAVTLWAGAMFAAANLLADILIVMVDPRKVAE